MTNAYLPSYAERKSLVKIRDETNYFLHQADGIRIMANMENLLLADDMGLGKSLQALTVAAIDFEWGIAKRVLIVAPSTLKWNWEAEIHEHTHFTCWVLDGSPKKRSEILEVFDTAGVDILIVNYEQIKSHLKELNALHFDIAIYDEAHYIKNPKAQRTKAAFDLHARRHLLLTGSPLLNQVNELWALLHRIDPERFPSYYRFINRYAVMGGYKNKQIVGVKNRPELNDILSGYMIRRRKSEVLKDLPPKMHVPVLVELHPEQARLYKEIEDNLKITDPDGSTLKEIDNVLVKVGYLKRACATSACLTDEDHSYKLDKCVEMIEEICDTGERLVVFTQFREAQARIVERMNRVNDARLAAHKRGDTRKAVIPVYWINGDTPQRDRVPMIQAWGADANPAVMVIMLQVGGVGLNMTAASNCIFVDKLWTPKMNEQAEDRLHRIGAEKDKPITIYHLLAKGTVEDKIEKALKRKTKIFDTLVEESDWKREVVRMLQEDES